MTCAGVIVVLSIKNVTLNRISCIWKSSDRKRLWQEKLAARFLAEVPGAKTRFGFYLFVAISFENVISMGAEFNSAPTLFLATY